MNQSETAYPSVGVLLVDDHAIWRGGVRSMFNDTEFEVVGEADSGREALLEAHRLHDNKIPLRLALLDIRMTGGDGLDALVALKAEHPQLAAIMLSTYDNPTYMARAVAGGASGYLLKGIERDELLVALRAVAGGEMLLRREDLTRSLRGISAAAQEADECVHPLSEREVEVLRLLSTGFSTN